MQEEGNQQQADVHTVHIGIGCYNHFVVTQSFDSVFYIQGCLEQVEFFVLVHHFLCQPERIQRFTTEAEYRLCVDITALGDGTACRVSLGDEDAGIFFQPFSFRVVEVDTAVTQFAVMQVSFLGTFAGQFRYACNGFAFLFRFLYLLLDGFGYVRILVEEVVHFQFDEVAYVFIDGHAAGRHVGRTQLRLGLALEDRFLHVDGNGGNESVADVRIIHVLVEELFDSTGDMFLESTLVSTSLGGVLTVDEGVIFFSVLSGVGEGYFDVFSFQVDDRVEAGCRHVVIQQVYKTVT